MVSLNLVYVTNPSKEEARRIGKHLLEKRLVVCANIYSGINSLYPWQGKLADETEHILICKTLPQYVEEVEKVVKGLHSYSIPCIVSILVSANQEYIEWAKKELN